MNYRFILLLISLTPLLSARIPQQLIPIIRRMAPNKLLATSRFLSKQGDNTFNSRRELETWLHCELDFIQDVYESKKKALNATTSLLDPKIEKASLLLKAERDYHVKKVLDYYENEVRLLKKSNKKSRGL